MPGLAFDPDVFKTHLFHDSFQFFIAYSAKISHSGIQYTAAYNPGRFFRTVYHKIPFPFCQCFHRHVKKVIREKFPYLFPVIRRLILIHGHNAGLRQGLLISQPFHDPLGKHRLIAGNIPAVQVLLLFVCLRLDINAPHPGIFGCNAVFAACFFIVPAHLEPIAISLVPTKRKDRNLRIRPADALVGSQLLKRDEFSLFRKCRVIRVEAQVQLPQGCRQLESQFRLLL